MIINVKKQDDYNTYLAGNFLCDLSKKDLENVINKNKAPFGGVKIDGWNLSFKPDFECLQVMPFIFTDTKVPEFKSSGIWQDYIIPAIYFDCTEQRFIEKAILVYQVKFEN